MLKNKEKHLRIKFELTLIIIMMLHMAIDIDTYVQKEIIKGLNKLQDLDGPHLKVLRKKATFVYRLAPTLFISFRSQDKIIF